MTVIHVQSWEDITLQVTSFSNGGCVAAIGSEHWVSRIRSGRGRRSVDFSRLISLLLPLSLALSLILYRRFPLLLEKDLDFFTLFLSLLKPFVPAFAHGFESTVFETLVRPPFSKTLIQYLIVSSPIHSRSTSSASCSSLKSYSSSCFFTEVLLQLPCFRWFVLASHFCRSYYLAWLDRHLLYIRYGYFYWYCCFS